MILLGDILIFIKKSFELLIISIRDRKIVRDHKAFLKEGKYKMSVKGDYIYEKSSGSNLKEKTYSSLTHFNKNFVFFLNKIADLFTYTVRYKGEKFFYGTEIILSSSLTEVKIFETENREVLTRYRDKEKLRKILLDKEYFGQYFNVPKTIKTDIKNSFIIEEFIKHTKFESKEALDYFCGALIKYFNEIRETVLYDNSGDEKRVSIFANNIGQSGFLSRIVGMPKVIVHGDFWRLNVIYDGTQYYIIDFEKKGVRFFLYDFFCFIFSECTLLEDDRLLESYFNGDYDDRLSKMFEVIGEKFDESLRGEYLIAFLVEILNERKWTKEKSDVLVGGLLRKYIPNYFS